jgi:hypothetical protein
VAGATAARQPCECHADDQVLSFDGLHITKGQTTRSSAVPPVLPHKFAVPSNRSRLAEALKLHLEPSAMRDLMVSSLHDIDVSLQADAVAESRLAQGRMRYKLFRFFGFCGLR